MKPDAEALGQGGEMRDGFGCFFRRDPLKQTRLLFQSPSKAAFGASWMN